MPWRFELNFFVGFYSGRWVVSPDFIHESTAAGRWLEEASYVWDNETSEDSNVSITSASMVNAPKRWREHLEIKNQRAFDGWNVAILVTNTKNRPAVYRRYIFLHLLSSLLVITERHSGALSHLNICLYYYTVKSCYSIE